MRHTLPTSVKKLPLKLLPVDHGVHPDDTDALLVVEAALRMGGRRVMGVGSYSVVGSHSKTRVVKVSPGLSDGFHDYYTWVQDNRGRLPPRIRRHLPRFYGAGLVGGVMVYVLEALTRDGYEETKSLREALGVVNDACPPGQRCDVYLGHESNILCRGDEGVITDPWAHEDSL